MLPNFFVVGAQKAGTTSLHQYLTTHPDIYLPTQKESKFFVFDERYNKGLAYYEQEYFSGWKGESVVGEVDPDYMYIPQALERIAKDLGVSKLKFIFIFRNPVERAFSHYLMTYRRGLEPLSFEDAIAEEESRLKKDQLSRMRYSYVNRGFYYRQVERFLRIINHSQMLFLLTDDLHSDAVGNYQKILNFLEVSTDIIPENIHDRFHGATQPRSMLLLNRIQQNEPTIEKKFLRLIIPWQGLRKKLRQKLLALNLTSSQTINLSDQARKKLSKVFKDENNKLAEFLDRNLNSWDYGNEINNNKM